ncbi:hypothetical protein GCM10009779_55720 [Polymorphospora rubra]|uniref:Uncharacterized protein n=1 Tax=Polymorphospora rubra TaxID=338584 RepID=A0A810N3U5_9ACTN|nr:hypothetical protein Prubr_34090 [Polymorphospora rubra]
MRIYAGVDDGYGHALPLGDGMCSVNVQKLQMPLIIAELIGVGWVCVYEHSGHGAEYRREWPQEVEFHLFWPITGPGSVRTGSDEGKTTGLVPC